jgi:hypothetical protein
MLKIIIEKINIIYVEKKEEFPELPINKIKRN